MSIDDLERALRITMRTEQLYNGSKFSNKPCILENITIDTSYTRKSRAKSSKHK